MDQGLPARQAGRAGVPGRDKAESERRWGTIDLLDILKYAEFDTDFIAEFTSVATRENLSKDVLRRRLLLVLFGLGTNMGIKRVAVTGKHGESEATLRRVRHLFVNRANMRTALVKLMKLVNATFAARDEMWWDSGTACAPNSRKFGSWSSNLMTEWHQRYRGPDVMIYWSPRRPGKTTTGPTWRRCCPPRRSAGRGCDGRSVGAEAGWCWTASESTRSPRPWR
ncbi:Tn3 family transposase [Streptomyces sp. NPDC006622]|uniref:Tn3 family transposase n=1 Tax=Streptomyces sp. NPDC006622 TaxID=3155459 RepID=UPI0033A2B288